MPISIDVPESAWAEQSVILDGFSYTFTYSYNSRNGGLYLTITGEDNEVILANVRLMQNELLLGRYKNPLFAHGDLVCIPYKATQDEVTLGNIGIDKTYELIYLTNEELGI